MSETITRSPPPETLNAQQLQAMQKQYQEALVALGKRMELRDRALDQACRACQGINIDVVPLAQRMFDFLTADLVVAWVPPTPARSAQ